MITKGIVVEVINNYQAKVRLPIFNSIASSKEGTPDSQLNIATICSLPNCNNVVQKGDIVFVAFEDNDISKPIILGHLYRENMGETYSSLDLTNLKILGSTNLSFDTNIGNVNANEISYLQGLEGNIQTQLIKLNDKIITYDTRLKLVGELTNNQTYTFGQTLSADIFLNETTDTTTCTGVTHGRTLLVGGTLFAQFTNMYNAQLRLNIDDTDYVLLNTNNTTENVFPFFTIISDIPKGSHTFKFKFTGNNLDNITTCNITPYDTSNYVIVEL